MDGVWRHSRFKFGLTMVFAATLVFGYNLSPCWSLNTEGLALLKFRDGVEVDPLGVLSGWNGGGEWDDLDHCSWFGVECSNGKVVILNLSNLCLKGSLAPELGKLSNVKSIILRNNSFYGKIPQEIGELKELEVLDLGYNNFSGPFPADLGNNFSLSILLLDNNDYLDTLSPEVHKLKTLSEFQVNEEQLTSSHNAAGCNSMCTSWNAVQAEDVPQRKLLKVSPSRFSPSRSIFPSIAVPPSTISSPSESPSPSEFSAPSPSPVTHEIPTPASPPVASPKLHPALPPSPASIPSLSDERSSKRNHHKFLIWSGVVGGSAFLFLSAFVFCICRRSKVVTVKPWATGLSGQLQKAFTTGVPSLQRSELVTACEDFSNIIGSLSDGTVYKGTLSSGVEIAVTSTTVTSVKDWTKALETQFRNKIDMLSKVNHKNFVNLIGYCEEENPFTRMMVFEYAPSGTLFEHLHIREAEHLDWFMRLRIAMGVAYCLEYLHQLNPPISHLNLNSSSIYLTEDYAAKISDFSFCRKETAAKMRPSKTELLETTCSSPESNVYSYGVILLEIITGKMPNSAENGSNDWVLDYLEGGKPMKEMVDPSLNSYKEDVVEKLFELVKSCVRSDPSQRPTMKEITARLKEITTMTPDGATPKTSPLWWAELEILSTEAS